MADMTPNTVPNATAAPKRKREKSTASKFYSVRIGRQPGIYYSWNECLDQVNAFPKAVYKAFSSLTDAESFLQGESGGGNPSKWYGVRAGRTPGVYTSWQDVLDQVTGWKGAKQKAFKTRTEAEKYVAGDPTLNSDKGAAGSDTGEPAPKKAKVGRPRKSEGVKDESHLVLESDNGEYRPGEAPLLQDAEDNFDTLITLDHQTNGARYKTREEREMFKYQAVRPIQDAAIRIYTDGSALSNGRAEALGGVGVFFGPGDRRNISEPLPGTKQTNQRAELSAIMRALEVAPRDRKIIIVSDSKYAIDCVTDWFQNWRRNGWVNSARKPVENKDLVQKVTDMLEERFRLNRHRMDEEDEQVVEGGDKRSYWNRGPAGVKFEWVKGHAKDQGNTAADSLAVAGARTAQEFDGEIDLDE